MALPALRLANLDDLLRADAEGRAAEIIDGELVEKAMADQEHGGAQLAIALTIGDAYLGPADVTSLGGPTSTWEIKKSTVVPWALAWTALIEAVTAGAEGAFLALALFEAVMFKTLQGPSPASAALERLKAWEARDFAKFLALGRCPMLSMR
jgi:hypothetical protein